MTLVQIYAKSVSQYNVIIGSHVPWKPGDFLRTVGQEMDFHVQYTLDQKGYPKEPIAGNQDCWYGQFVYLTQHLVDKNDLDSKFLQLYNFRKKKFGTANVSKGVAKQALREFCNLVGVKKDKSINNISKRIKLSKVRLRLG